MTQAERALLLLLARSASERAKEEMRWSSSFDIEQAIAAVETENQEPTQTSLSL